MRVSDDRVPAEEFDEVMNAVSATSLIARTSPMRR